MRLKLESVFLIILIFNVIGFMNAYKGVMAQTIDSSNVLGEVFSINGNSVDILCRGSSVKIGETLYILQAGKPVGKLQVTQTYHTKVKAKIIESSVKLVKGLDVGKWKGIEKATDITTPNSVIKPGNKFKNSIGMEFISIPAGEFTMGCVFEGIKCSVIEDKIHKVKITKNFSIGKYEVTQGQWKAVMGNNPSYFKDCGDNCPVEQVSWEDAIRFLNKLSIMEEKTPAYQLVTNLIFKDQFVRIESANGYRLPTEAEWEYATRAGTKTKYYSDDLDSISWYDINSNSKTHPVGQKKPNAFGLYDMLGNVREWVDDWYGEYSIYEVVDPVGPTSGSYRVIRGGAWFFSQSDSYSYARGLNIPTYREEALGFRVVSP